MKRFLAPVLISFVIVLLIVVVVFSMLYKKEQAEITVTINGTKTSHILPIIRKNGIMYLPLKEISNLLGVTVDWTVENKIEATGNSDFFQNDRYLANITQNSLEGTLTSGRKYKFTGLDDPTTGSFKHDAEEFNLGVNNDISYDKVGPVLSPQLAAELGEGILSGNSPIDASRIGVYYDTEIKSWIVYNINTNVTPGLFTIVVIRAIDGMIEIYNPTWP